VVKSICLFIARNRHFRKINKFYKKKNQLKKNINLLFCIQKTPFVKKKYCIYALGQAAGQQLATVYFFVNTRNCSLADLVFITDTALGTALLGDATQICLDKNANPKVLAQALDQCFDDYQIEEVFVLAFPAGIKGELNYLTNRTPIFHYIAQYLNWNIYKHLISQSSLRFNTVYTIEEQKSEQNMYILQYAKRFERIRLQAIPSDTTIFSDENFVLILHTGFSSDLPILIDLATKKMRELSSTICRIFSVEQPPSDLPSMFVWSDDWALWAQMHRASAIVSSADMICMQLTKKHREKHHFVAFDALYDDQAHRVEVRQEGHHH